MLTEKEFYKYLGHINIYMADNKNTSSFIDTIDELIELLEEASNEDVYGTGGYKHLLGWDEYIFGWDE